LKISFGPSAEPLVKVINLLKRFDKGDEFIEQEIGLSYENAKHENLIDHVSFEDVNFYFFKFLDAKWLFYGRHEASKAH
jgi:hypothetical protein